MSRVRAADRIEREPAVQLGADVTRSLVEAIEAARPWEACAVLFGEDARGLLAFDAVRIVENRARRVDRFQVSLEAIRALEAEVGRSIAGFFHSHTGRLQLSADDMQSMSRLPVAWLVGRLDAQGRLETRAFRMRGRRVFIVHRG